MLRRVADPRAHAEPPPPHRHRRALARGLGLTSWRYLWRTTPLSRRELTVIPTPDRAPPLPAGFDTDGVQAARGRRADVPSRLSGGHRRRRRLRRDLIETMRRDPDVFAPSEFASFEEVEAEDSDAPGEEYVVRMPGPWDGPVRAVAVTDVVPPGHVGRTPRSRADRVPREHEGDRLVFTIESWARSADRLTDILYDRLRMSKEIQLHMWPSVLERVIRALGGRRKGWVEVQHPAGRRAGRW